MNLLHWLRQSGRAAWRCEHNLDQVRRLRDRLVKETIPPLPVSLAAVVLVVVVVDVVR